MSASAALKRVLYAISFALGALLCVNSVACLVRAGEGILFLTGCADALVRAFFVVGCLFAAARVAERVRSRIAVWKRGDRA